MTDRTNKYKAEVETWIIETYPEDVIEVALPALEAVADSEWDYYFKQHEDAPSDAAAEIVESALEGVRNVTHLNELILNTLRSWDFGPSTRETMRKHYAEVIDDMVFMVESLREL